MQIGPVKLVLLMIGSAIAGVVICAVAVFAFFTFMAQRGGEGPVTLGAPPTVVTEPPSIAESRLIRTSSVHRWKAGLAWASVPRSAKPSP